MFCNLFFILWEKAYSFTCYVLFQQLRGENLAPFQEFESHFNPSYYKRVALYQKAIFETTMVRILQKQVEKQYWNTLHKKHCRVWSICKAIIMNFLLNSLVTIWLKKLLFTLSVFVFIMAHRFGVFIIMINVQSYQ